ncbi:MAG: non-canonical purine NTP pyrophosphatase [Candidatus Peregrinibacteria bacterium]
MRPPRLHQGQDGTSFFVTTVTKDRRRIFDDPKMADIAQELIHRYNKRGDYWLLEYVIMPDHLHLLIAPRDKTLSQCLHNLKRTIAQQINDFNTIKGEDKKSVGQEYSCPTDFLSSPASSTKNFITIHKPALWQLSFHDIIIRSNEQRDTIRRYILDNPVKDNLCVIAEDYPFSSINRETDRHFMAAGEHYPDARPPLLIATSNRGKVQEISEVLKGLPIDILTPVDLAYIEDEPEETGMTFKENALQKAQFYYDRSGLPTVADDSGIIVEALQNELGLHTRRWGAGPKASDQEWIEYFLKRMKKERNKRARFVCALAYIHPQSSKESPLSLQASGWRGEGSPVQSGVDGGVRQEVRLFEGRCNGVITETLEADYLPGLPISACFRPDGYDRVFSALTIVQKNSTSHRGKATLALVQYLHSQ